MASSFKKNLLKGKPIHVISYKMFLKISKGRKVIILRGYFGLGYEDVAIIKEHIRYLVRIKGDHTFYVFQGKKGGIENAMNWIPKYAMEFGLNHIKTVGFLSTIAKRKTFLCPDYLVVSNEKTNTMVKMAEDTQSEMIYFKGGFSTKEEIEEGLDRGVHITLFNDPRISPKYKIQIQKSGLPIDGTKGFLGQQKKYSNLRVIEFSDFP